MTGEEMERAIQFLIEHHARVRTDIEGLKQAQEKTAMNLESLAQTVARLGAQAEADRREMRERFDSASEEMRQRFQRITEEMRNGFNKLMLSNEITRDLADKIGHLAVTRSQRVTVLEDKFKYTFRQRLNRKPQ